MTWRRQGKAPDYRFSLANERTFLAWIRTAMTLLAGAVGIDQLAPNLAPPLYRELIAAGLSITAGLIAFYAYRRWSNNEQAMRLGLDLSYSHSLKIISFIVGILAILFISLVLTL